MADDLIAKKKVAYYSGCFANYYYPQVGQATIEVLGRSGIEVVVPDQVCCALPMVAKGNMRGAYKNITHNTRVLGRLVSNGCALVTTCSSCGLFFKREYPRILANEAAVLVSKNLYHITEYLAKLYEIGHLNTNFKSLYQTVFYHTPCHLRAQQIDNPTLKILQLIPSISIKKVTEECCGMGGSYGYEKTNYKLSQAIAGKLYSDIKANPTDRIVTDCGGCKLQIEAGTNVNVDHPIILIREAYSL